MGDARARAWVCPTGAPCRPRLDKAGCKTIPVSSLLFAAMSFVGLQSSWFGAAGVYRPGTGTLHRHRRRRRNGPGCASTVPVRYGSVQVQVWKAPHARRRFRQSRLGRLAAHAALGRMWPARGGRPNSAPPIGPAPGEQPATKTKQNTLFSLALLPAPRGQKSAQPSLGSVIAGLAHPVVAADADGLLWGRGRIWPHGNAAERAALAVTHWLRLRCPRTLSEHSHRACSLPPPCPLRRRRACCGLDMPIAMAAAAGSSCADGGEQTTTTSRIGRDTGRASDGMAGDVQGGRPWPCHPLVRLWTSTVQERSTARRPDGCTLCCSLYTSALGWT